ncbi:MAG TPA: MarR family transcriptional regulator [Candidatus Methanoperedens sp.]
MILKIFNICIIFLIFIAVAHAAPENYRTTYTIDIKENGSAIWNVEYRTLLTTTEDFNSFDNYSKQLKSVYIPEFMELMQRSASEAASATSRDMVARDFSGNTRDVTPKPDQSRDELIWYGLRSFEAGEPRIIFSKSAFPWGTAVIIVAAIAVIVASGSYFSKQRKEDKTDPQPAQNMEITEIEMLDVEERILKLLKEGGGELYQSEIGRQLELPKSSVSSALNQLNDRKLILKIKKGRENLIRLA